MKPYRPSWSKDQDRAWRSTFTRENKVGERKLMFDLRHKGSDRLVQEQKAASEERGRARTAEKADLYFRQAKDALGFHPSDIGLKERITYRRTDKLIERFDGRGNLLEAETVPYGG